MRIYKKSNNLIKIQDKNRTIYVCHKNFKLIEADYFKEMIKPLIVEQSRDYVILTGIGYYKTSVMCFDNVNSFLNGCCGLYGLGVKREEILKYVNN